MKNKYLILPVLAGVLWGSAGVFVRILAAQGMSPETMLFSRVAVSVVMMAIGIYIYDRNLLKIKIKDLGWLVGCGITGTLAFNICYVRAVEEVSLSLAAVLLALCPVFVILMAAVIFKEKPARQKLFCGALVLAGCVLVSGMLETDGLHWTWQGILLGLGAALFYAMYSIVSKKTMERGYNVFTIIFYSTVFVTVALIPLTDWEVTGQYLSEKTIQHIIFLLFYGLCTSILPFVAFTVALKHADAGKVSILSSGGEPVAASILGMLIYGEMPTMLSVLGLAVTVGALALLCLAEQKELREAAGD